MKRATVITKLLFCKAIISIHALVKRATPLYGCDTAIDEISIHALVKRATLINSVKNNSISISIHALVKRATFFNGNN